MGVAPSSGRALSTLICKVSDAQRSENHGDACPACPQWHSLSCATRCHTSPVRLAGVRATDNSALFRDINAVRRRRVVAESPGYREVEVEQVGQVCKPVVWPVPLKTACSVTQFRPLV